MKDLKTMGKCKCEIEKSKQTLSFRTSTRVEIKSFHNVNNSSMTLTRANIEELDIDLIHALSS